MNQLKAAASFRNDLEICKLKTVDCKGEKRDKLKDIIKNTK